MVSHGPGDRLDMPRRCADAAGAAPTGVIDADEHYYLNSWWSAFRAEAALLNAEAQRARSPALKSLYAAAADRARQTLADVNRFMEQTTVRNSGGRG